MVSVSLGTSHSCAILADGGLLKCFGKNEESQLGLDGYTAERGDNFGEMGDALPPVPLFDTC